MCSQIHLGHGAPHLESATPSDHSTSPPTPADIRQAPYCPSSPPAPHLRCRYSLVTADRGGWPYQSSCPRRRLRRPVVPVVFSFLSWSYVTVVVTPRIAPRLCPSSFFVFFSFFGWCVYGGVCAYLTRKHLSSPNFSLPPFLPFPSVNRPDLRSSGAQCTGSPTGARVRGGTFSTITG